MLTETTTKISILKSQLGQGKGRWLFFPFNLTLVFQVKIVIAKREI